MEWLITTWSHFVAGTWSHNPKTKDLQELSPIKATCLHNHTSKSLPTLPHPFVTGIRIQASSNFNLTNRICIWGPGPQNRLRGRNANALEVCIVSPFIKRQEVLKLSVIRATARNAFKHVHVYNISHLKWLSKYMAEWCSRSPFSHLSSCHMLVFFKSPLKLC